MKGPAMQDTLLNIENVTKVYRNKQQEVHALKGVSLNVYKGEILSLLGVNGAGKTTLSSILATLHPPTTGDVIFKGMSIYKDVVRYRKSLGFCSQKPNLDTALTVYQNLLFAGRYFLMPEKEVVARVNSLLDQFNLHKYAHFNVNNLSGGYKQRLMIARALIHNPELVILDEPTVALDPGIRRQLWDQIKELRERGVTIILTTHYLEEAEILSDRVCILDQGEILLTDKPHNLKEQFQKVNLEEVFLHLTQEEAA
jgi:ABC-2 type transport system ATP-binding protein